MRRHRLPPVDVEAPWLDVLTALALGCGVLFLAAVLLRWRLG